MAAFFACIENASNIAAASISGLQTPLASLLNFVGGGMLYLYHRTK